MNGRLKGLDRVIVDSVSKRRHCRLVPVLVVRSIYGQSCSERNAEVFAIQTDDPTEKCPSPRDDYLFLDTVMGRMVRFKAYDNPWAQLPRNVKNGQTIYFSIALLIGAERWPRRR